MAGERSKAGKPSITPIFVRTAARTGGWTPLNARDLDWLAYILKQVNKEEVPERARVLCNRALRRYPFHPTIAWASKLIENKKRMTDLNSPLAYRAAVITLRRMVERNLSKNGEKVFFQKLPKRAVQTNYRKIIGAIEKGSLPVRRRW